MTNNQLKPNPIKTQLLVIQGDGVPTKIEIYESLWTTLRSHHMLVLQPCELHISPHIAEIQYSIRTIRAFLYTDATLVLIQIHYASARLVFPKPSHCCVPSNGSCSYSY